MKISRYLLTAALLLGAPAGFADRVSLHLEQSTVGKAVELLWEQTATRINTFDDVGEMPVEELRVQDATMQDTLNAIANPLGLIWWKEDNGQYGITTRRYYERNLLPGGHMRTVFKLEKIDAVEVGDRLKPLLTPNWGSLVVDQRTSKVIVTDYPEVLNQMRALVKEWDVPSSATLARRAAQGDTSTTGGVTQRPVATIIEEVLRADSRVEDAFLSELKRRREERMKARMSETKPPVQPLLPAPHEGEF